MNCVIVDDEPLAIKVIEKHLSLVNGFKIMATFDSALPVYNYLQGNKVDLIFLDLEMPNLSGLNFLKSLSSQPQIIVTTAHREYALESYDYLIADYLLKPISFERFLKAISKLEKQPTTIKSTQITPSEPNNNPNDGFAYFRVDRQNVQLHFKDIVFIESVKNHVKLVLSDTQYITHVNLQEVERKLNPKSFIRVHKSYIVAKDRIQSFTNTNLQVNNQLIPIGRSYKQNVMKILSERIF